MGLKEAGFMGLVFRFFNQSYVLAGGLEKLDHTLFERLKRASTLPYGSFSFFLRVAFPV